MAALQLPAGPRGRFFTGSLKEFLRDRLGFLTRIARDYGDVVPLHLGPRRIILVSHPAAIEEVLVSKNGQFTKHSALRVNRLVLGNGLLTSDGDFWLRQRRLAQPAFQRQQVARYAPTVVEQTRQLLATWTPGETRDVLVEMMRLTLGIAAKTLFGADAASHAGDVGAALAVTQQQFVSRYYRLVPLPMWIPTAENLRMRRAVRTLDEIIYGFIRQRRAAGADSGGTDLLSLLLHARDDVDQSRMSDQQLRDEALTLFLAGHETTALTLTWAWFLLAKNPAAQEPLVAECDRVLGDREATFDDLPRLKYAEHVVQEAMRLYPPAWVIGREAREACEIGGYAIARGATLLMSQWIVHRDPRFYDQPDEFRPERWEGDAAARLPKFAYFPFGGGPRVCIGNTFAMLEAVLALATIARAYRFTLDPQHPVEPHALFTLRPRAGVRAPLTPRC